MAAGPAIGHTVEMVGAVIIVVVLVVLIPVGFLMSMVIPAGVIGTLLKNRAEALHADSELLDTNY